MEIDQLTSRVIGCIIRVHQTLGPGFQEQIYRRALLIELRGQCLFAETEKQILIYYKGVQIGRHVLDIVVEDQLIIELKTVEALSKAHYAQVRSYLKSTNLKAALLVNFSSHRADFRRVRLATFPSLPHPPSYADEETHESV